MSRETKYSLLVQDNHDDDDEDANEVQETHSFSSASRSLQKTTLLRFSRWLLYAVGALTFLECCLLILLPFVFSHPRSLNPPDDYLSATSILEYRSTYINFDRLYNTSSQKKRPRRRKPIDNRAIGMTQVSSAHIHNSYPMWDRYYVSWDAGVVPMDDQRLVANSTVSTIVQFRVIDYGMEKCGLELRTSGMRDSVAGNGGLNYNGLVDVWLLVGPSSRKMDFSTLTWSTKPSRRQLVGQFDPQQEPVQLRVDPCVSGTFLTFEIACSTRNDMDCSLDMTTLEEERSKRGLVLVQSQSI